MYCYEEDQDCDESREIDYPDEQDVWWSDDEDYVQGSFFSQPVTVHFTPQGRKRIRLCEGKQQGTRAPVNIRKNAECVICLEKLTSRNSYCAYSCGNVFHTDCLKHLQLPQKCPMCRTPAKFLKVSISTRPKISLTKS
jgi:hypothetical protein